MYVNTQTLQRMTESEIRQAFPNTSFPTPFVPPDEYAVVFASPQPTYDPVIRTVRETTPVMIEDQWFQQWEVVPRFSEYTDDEGVVHTVAAQEAAAIAADLAAKAEAESATIKRKVEALWAAADKYTSNYISGVAIGILTIGVMQQKPKALAVSAWSSSVWTEYYRRKALVTLDSVDDHDFSSFGPIPHSVPELQAEVGL